MHTCTVTTVRLYYYKDNSKLMRLQILAQSYLATKHEHNKVPSLHSLNHVHDVTPCSKETLNCIHSL